MPTNCDPDWISEVKLVEKLTPEDILIFLALQDALELNEAHLKECGTELRERILRSKISSVRAYLK